MDKRKTESITVKITDVKIGTACLICGESVILHEEIGPKICEKCKAAVMQVRRGMERSHEMILD